MSRHAACVAFIVGLAACGGGGGGSVTPTALSGKVADGYIQGATVYLDLNNNQTQDSGEPSAVTSAGGSYSLSTTGLTAAQIKAAHLVTVVPSTAKDEDDGGKTIAEAGKKAFTLMAPAEAYVGSDGNATGALISPLTTLVSQKMVSGGGVSLAAAKAAAATSSGLTEAQIMSDVAALDKTDTVRRTAQAVAVAIGEMKTSIADGAKTASITATDREVLLASLAQIQKVVAELKKQVDALTDSSSSALVNKITDSVKNDATVKPNATTLINEAKVATSSEVTDFITAAKSGLYSINNSCFFDTSSSCTSAGFWKILASSTDYVFTQSVYVLETSTSTSWTKRSKPTTPEKYLTASGWVDLLDDASGTVMPEGTGMLVTETYINRKFRYTARKQALKGVSFKQHLQQVASKSGYSYSANSSATDSQMFPDGAFAYWGSGENLQDEYYLWGAPYVSYANGTPVELASFDALFETYLGNITNGYGKVRYYAGDKAFSFDVGGTATGGNVTLYSYLGNCSATSAASSCGLVKSGSSTYRIVEPVVGYKVLVVDVTESSYNNSPMYAIYKGKVYEGSYTKANTATADGTPTYNAAALKAIAAFRKLPTTLP